MLASGEEEWGSQLFTCCPDCGLLTNVGVVHDLIPVDSPTAINFSLLNHFSFQVLALVVMPESAVVFLTVSVVICCWRWLQWHSWVEMGDVMQWVEPPTVNIDICLSFLTLWIFYLFIFFILLWIQSAHNFLLYCICYCNLENFTKIRFNYILVFCTLNRDYKGTSDLHLRWSSIYPSLIKVKILIDNFK